MYFAEILYLSKNKLGYTDRDAKHLYIGEYSEQLEIFKKYHNIEVKKILFVENNEEESKKIEDNENPQWFIDYQKSQKGI